MVFVQLPTPRPDMQYNMAFQMVVHARPEDIYRIVYSLVRLNYIRHFLVT